MPTPPSAVAHLLRRAGFGGSPAEIAALAPLDIKVIVQRLVDPSVAVPLPTPDLVADPVGQRHRAVGGEADQRREAAVGGEADRAAQAAEVVAAGDAGLADPAAPAGVGGDPVADRDLGHALADGGHDRGELVPQRHRRFLPGQRVRPAGADREGLAVLADVGAADAAEADLGLDHPRPERKRQLDLVEPHVTSCVPAHSLHRGRR